jgi:hypothetical protein
MSGLDPRIHDEMLPAQALQWLVFVQSLMDCRVKPGNDDAGMVRALR